MMILMLVFCAKSGKIRVGWVSRFEILMGKAKKEESKGVKALE
jgi:hypothetical protein